MVSYLKVFPIFSELWSYVRATKSPLFRRYVFVVFPVTVGAVGIECGRRSVGHAGRCDEPRGFP